MNRFKVFFEQHNNCFKIWSGRFSKNWETQPDTSPTRERTAMSQEQHKYYFKIWSGRFPKLGNFQRIVEKTVTERHQDCFYRWPGRFPRLGNTISHFIYERKDNHVTKTVLFLLQDMLWPISKNGETYSWLLKKLQLPSFYKLLGSPRMPFFVTSFMWRDFRSEGATFSREESWFHTNNTDIASICIWPNFPKPVNREIDFRFFDTFGLWYFEPLWPL